MFIYISFIKTSNFFLDYVCISRFYVGSAHEIICILFVKINLDAPFLLLVYFFQFHLALFARGVFCVAVSWTTFITTQNSFEFSDIYHLDKRTLSFTISLSDKKKSRSYGLFALIKNSTFFKIIGWVTGSIISSTNCLMVHAGLDLGHPKLFIFVFVKSQKNINWKDFCKKVYKKFWKKT